MRIIKDKSLKKIIKINKMKIQIRKYIHHKVTILLGRQRDNLLFPY